jgi:hypothetical protein
MCAAFVVLAALIPAAADAQQPTCEPSPDVAALDQYCDFLPSAEGEVTPLSAAVGPTQMALNRALPSRDAKRLRDAGPEGRALLMLPAIAPVRPDVRRRLRDTAEDVLRSTDLDPPKVTPEAVVSGLGAAGGQALGGVFQWGLLICTVGFAGMAWLRFRTRLKL